MLCRVGGVHVKCSRSWAAASSRARAEGLVTACVSLPLVIVVYAFLVRVVRLRVARRRLSAVVGVAVELVYRRVAMLE
jgi:hypothetical protein